MSTTHINAAELSIIKARTCNIIVGLVGAHYIQVRCFANVINLPLMRFRKTRMIYYFLFLFPYNII